MKVRHASEVKTKRKHLHFDSDWQPMVDRHHLIGDFIGKNRAGPRLIDFVYHDQLPVNVLQF